MVTGRIPISWLLAALAVPAGPVAGGAPREPASDAAFVRMTVPERVMVHEVFPVAITMRNTGTSTWAGGSIRLRAIHPQNNTLWGTSYILIAQGTAVKPEEEYTFRSNLRAPSDSGPMRFQWQLSRDGTHWFGATTPARTIEVTPRPREGAESPRPRERGADGKRILAFDDFEYLGSFKPPRTVGEARGAFSECGLALRPMADGRGRLLVNYTHPTQILFEIEVPDLVRIEGGAHAALKTADIERIWGPLAISTSGGQRIHPNGGFTWMEETRTLLWTWYHGYKTGDAPPILGATRLSEDGAIVHRGSWYVAAPRGLYKSYWGGVIALPRAFADKYTGGKTLALGFGGYYSICALASRGPALGAIPDPVECETAVPVTAMLYHPHDSPAPRDGDYFNANCGFWSDQPAGPGRGTWTYDDRCRAGVFIDMPTAYAYVAFVRLGTGRLGYDFGAITSAGASEYWYIYDPKDLGEAAAGERAAGPIAPAAMTKVSYPLGRTVTGACFDARRRRLYVCVSRAYPVGRESYPVIHVYAVQ